MRGLVQRVSFAKVEVDNQVVGEIEQGILLLLGIEKQDEPSIADKLLQRILSCRMFNDSAGKMNLSLSDIDGGLLVVPQFTLAADLSGGKRPSFSKAAPPESAKSIVDYFINQAKQQHPNTESGIFAADMQVSLCNDGPVTFLFEQ